MAGGGRDLESAAWNYRPDITVASPYPRITPRQARDVYTACRKMSTNHWWSGACGHYSPPHLIYPIEGNTPLRNTIREYFEHVHARFSSASIVAHNGDGGVAAAQGEGESKRDDVATVAAASVGQTAIPEIERRLAAQAELEFGLAQHQWGAVKEAKANFKAAQNVTGLVSSLTGFRGRRTKYQEFDTTHLVVVANYDERGLCAVRSTKADG